MNKRTLLVYLIGAFINVSTIVCVKYSVIKHILKLDQIIFFRTFFATLLLTPIVIKDIKQVVNVSKKDKRTLLFLCLLGLITSIDTYLWNTGLQMVPINNGMIMLFLSPIINALFAKFILKETIAKNVTKVFIINSCALFLIYHFSFERINIGYLLITMDLVICGLIAILIKKLKNCSSNFLVFIRFAVLLPVSYLAMKTVPVFDSKITLSIILITAGYLVEKILITKVYQIASVVSIQPLRYFNVIFSIVLSYIILGEQLNISQIIGILIIITSGFLLQTEK